MHWAAGVFFSFHAPGIGASLRLWTGLLAGSYRRNSSDDHHRWAHEPIGLLGNIPQGLHSGTLNGLTLTKRISILAVLFC